MGNRIKEQRELLGLSQYKLAEKVGISRVSISKIETGQVIPNLKTANNIANALNTCMYKIFNLDGEENYRCGYCQCNHEASFV